MAIDVNPFVSTCCEKMVSDTEIQTFVPFRDRSGHRTGWLKTVSLTPKSSTLVFFERAPHSEDVIHF